MQNYKIIFWTFCVLFIDFLFLYTLFESLKLYSLRGNILFSFFLLPRFSINNLSYLIFLNSLIFVFVFANINIFLYITLHTLKYFILINFLIELFLVQLLFYYTHAFCLKLIFIYFCFISERQGYIFGLDEASLQSLYFRRTTATKTDKPEKNWQKMD